MSDGSGGEMTGVNPYQQWGMTKADYGTTIGTGMGETHPRARNVVDFAGIFDTGANRTQNMGDFVPSSYMPLANGKLDAVFGAPMFNNPNLPQYNAWSPKFGAAYANAQMGERAALDPTYYGGLSPGRQSAIDNANIAVYGVSGPPGDLRGVTKGATEYNNPFLTRDALVSNQLRGGKEGLMLGTPGYQHQFNSNPSYPDFDVNRGVVDATTGYFRQFTPGVPGSEYADVSKGDFRGWGAWPSNPPLPPQKGGFGAGPLLADPGYGMDKGFNPSRFDNVPARPPSMGMDYANPAWSFGVESPRTFDFGPTYGDTAAMGKALVPNFADPAYYPGTKGLTQYADTGQRYKDGVYGGETQFDTPAFDPSRFDAVPPRRVEDIPFPMAADPWGGKGASEPLTFDMNPRGGLGGLGGWVEKSSPATLNAATSITNKMNADTNAGIQALMAQSQFTPVGPQMTPSSWQMPTSSGGGGAFSGYGSPTLYI